MRVSLRLSPVNGDFHEFKSEFLINIENLNLREWNSSFPQNGITVFFFLVPILLASNLHLSKPKQTDDIPGFQAVIRVHGNLIVVYIIQLF